MPSMQLCIENVDQAGGCGYGYSCVYTDAISWAGADQAAADDPRSARRVRRVVRRLGTTPAKRARARTRIAASSTGSSSSSARLQNDAWRRPIARGSPTISTTFARSNGASRRRGAQRQRRAARAARRASRRAGFIRGARQADVRSAGAGVCVGRHARVRVQAGARRIEPRLPGKRLQRRVPYRRRITAGEDRRFVNFAKINTYHVSLMPYFSKSSKKCRTGTARCWTTRS